jgi:glycosyltransferase involved in cell wall biosynthesis
MIGRCLFICPSPAHDVIGDLIRGLEDRGWKVDVAPAPTPRDNDRLWCRLDAWLAHRNSLTRTLARLARRVRREFGGAAEYSAWFDRLDASLARRDHDVVVAYLDGNPTGLARLVTRACPDAVLVSLVALTQELRQRRMLPALRAAATMRARHRLHADLFRPADATVIRRAVFPSDAWKEAARAAGVPASVASMIPLGVRTAAAPIRRFRQRSAPARLLWAGRLSPEKGLHVFLEALPLVRTGRDVKLTVIAAPGPSAYARRITAQVERLGLRDVVEMRGSLSRRELLETFARHDVLLFHSIFAEPVAQVMLHAAAAGLPVVGPASPGHRSLLREGQTAWCFENRSPECIADTIVRALENPEARMAHARALRAEVRRDHDLAGTVARFDALLKAQAVGTARESHTWNRSSAHS